MPDLRILLLRLLLDLLNRHVADDNRPSHPELDRSSCFHGSILSLEMIEHFEARCTLDVIKCREVLSFFNSPRETCIGAEFGQIEGGLEDLRTSARIHATGFRVLLHQSEKFDLLSTLLVALPWFPGYQALRVSPYSSIFFGSFPCQFFTHLRYCSVDTEVSDGNNCTKNHFDGFVAAIELYRRPSFSFALQISSFKRIGSSKNGMSTFTEINHHNISDIIPFSIWFVYVSFVRLLFWSQSKKRPMSLRELSSILWNHIRIRNTVFLASTVDVSVSGRFEFPPYSLGLHGNSEVPGPSLPLRVFSYSCPISASVCHTWELDVASWLCFLAAGRPVLFQSGWQGVLSIPRLFDAIGLCRVDELVMRDQVHRRLWLCHDPLFYSVLASFSPSFWCSLSSWNSWRSKLGWNGLC